MDLLDMVKCSDLPPEQQDLAETIGIETYIKLVRICGGQYVYILKSEGIVRLKRNALIKEDFTGYNYKALAKKYNLSEVMIRNIINNYRKEDEK